MTELYLSPSEKETPHGKQCLNSMAGLPMYLLKMQRTQNLKGS